MTTNKAYFNNKIPLTKGGALASKRDGYKSPGNRKEYQLFSSDYFSNADVKIYFGDIWIDDATAIAFQLEEELMPVYGYNSYTYDSVARGKRLIQGHFAINFLTVGYMHQVLENANAIYYALSEGKKKGLISPQYYENMKLNDILKKLGKSSFDQIADEYEKAIWGAADDKDQDYLSYSNQPFFHQDDLGFDIRIQYGAVSETSDYVSGKFYQSSKTEAPNMTVDVINGVQLSGLSKSIATSDAGAPIQEMYSFIARDLNGVSFAQLKRSLGINGGSQKQADNLGTVYRKMQYGSIS